MPEVDLDGIRRIRAEDPAAIGRAAASRGRRPFIHHGDQAGPGRAGRLFLLAADHGARGALGVRGDPQAMADRNELLRRLVAALARPGVDGVLGSADVLEDLLLLGALEGKVVAASMNRGGIQGSSFEVDDRFTGYDVEGIVAMNFDAGKMLCRIAPNDASTASTLESCGKAVTELARVGLPALIEPFMSSRREGALTNDLSNAAVIRSVAIASGLGATSAYTWLKLPVTDDMEPVMAATTLPTLLLGGDPSGRPDDTYAKWARALDLPGVRGLVVGRSLLYPPGGDVEAAVDTAAALVRPDMP
jgi:DhnA family fructose-bisphosphate aldolase class Ia